MIKFICKFELIPLVNPVNLYRVQLGGEMVEAKKQWAKPNVTPATAKVIRQIAMETGRFGYEVIDDVFMRACPEYF